MFAGRRYDIEIGLYYNRARYYNPYTGRFLQTDPIGYGDGMNMYTYCLNNPTNVIDPSGCFPLQLMARGVVRVANILIRRALAAARQKFYEKNNGKPLDEWEEEPTKYTFGIPQLFSPDSLNPALHFLGSFSGVITPGTDPNGEDTITVTNIVSWESYWRILDRFGFPLQHRMISCLNVIDDMKMTITWTEQVAEPARPPTDPNDPDDE